MCQSTDRERLIEDNLNLVNCVIRKHFKVHMNEYDDLYQVGCIGLIKAADRYNPEVGPFVAYAYGMILGNILFYLRESYAVKFSREYKELYFKLNRACENINDEDELKATCLLLEIDLEKAKNALSIYNRCTQFTYLDYVVSSTDKNPNVHELITDDSNTFTELSDTKMLIDMVFDKIDAYSATVLKMYYIDNLNQPKIAEIMHKTQAQISRDLKIALTSAKNVLNGEKALTRKKPRGLTYEGRTMNITEWANELKINRNTIVARLHRGFSVKDALGF